jgi:AraC-like DNA-binding protein
MAERAHEPERRVPTTIEIRKALARKIAAHARDEGQNSTAVDGLFLFRRTSPGACHWTTCEPSLTVFVQGRKSIQLGGKQYLCDESSFLLSSIEAPIQSRILEASPAVPLLSMHLRLRMSVVQEILSWDGLPESAAPSRGSGLAVGETTAELLGACARLLELLDRPEDIAFLGPLIQREIAYRILRSPQGACLRAIATRGHPSQRAARAIAWLRANYTQPLRIEELARLAHLGVSTLHRQFRALTGMSPLQYQKQLRLQASRHLMLAEGIDATRAAYEVGYQSASQFSREYRRLFGRPPGRDIKALRRNAAGASDAA